MIDRREKLAAYQNIPSLRYYLLVASDHVNVEYYQQLERCLIHLPVH
ncbi:MAG: hypothetical protein R3E08_09905 [Thiotrichaceae bacterium]